MKLITPTGRKDDSEKPRVDLLFNGCPYTIEEVSKILTFGANKYSANNWMFVENYNDRYLAAAQRHILEYCKGNIVDPESGCNHLSHAITSLMFINELNIKNNGETSK